LPFLLIVIMKPLNWARVAQPWGDWPGANLEGGSGFPES
jgi:hypothetical protein